MIFFKTGRSKEMQSSKFAPRWKSEVISAILGDMSRIFNPTPTVKLNGNTSFSADLSIPFINLYSANRTSKVHSPLSEIPIAEMVASMPKRLQTPFSMPFTKSSNPSRFEE